MSSETVKKMPFRDLPKRPKAVLPKWPLPSQKKEEVKYVLNCRGVPQNCVHDNAFHRPRLVLWLKDGARVVGIADPQTFQDVLVVFTSYLISEDALNNLIETFETRDDDVFICTYVKSGTTWTQHIINLATNWILEKINANTERRFFKTHANLKDIPCGKAPGVKVIYVCRNPKDVCVSLQHHAKNKPQFEYNGDLDDMLHFFAEGRCQNGNWFEHVLEWYEASKADPEHVMFLRYEDMLAEPAKHVEMIADFTGIKTTPEIVEKVVAASSISAMKNSSSANTMKHLNHLRKGGSGGWRDVFTVRQSETLDELYLEQMRDTGLEMDFGEGLNM